VIEVLMSVTGDQINLIVDRILLATDFSEASEVAASYARAIAKRFASTVTLANVIDLSIASRSEVAVVDNFSLRYAATVMKPGASGE
jgi:nucleotide-binding universal stress UspA family protein